MMKYQALYDYALKFPGVTSEFKVEWDAQLFKVNNKMFAMIGQNKQKDDIISVKLLPQNGIFYQEQYPSITPGYYLNKIHWISIPLEKDISMNLIQELLEQSYHYFVTTLPKKIQKELTE